MMAEKDESPPRDIAFRVIMCIVGAVVVWLLLTPFVDSVAMSTMKRFHLRSDHFASWAIQQPVPSMYNFANLSNTRDTPPGMIQSVLADEVQQRYVNHFPTRLMTFADGRYGMLNWGRHNWLELTTTYRGQSLQTTYYAKPIPDPNADPANPTGFHYEMVLESPRPSGDTQPSGNFQSSGILGPVQ